jgi:hypothetical protein
MNITFQIDTKLNTIFSKARGPISIDDLIHNAKAIQRHPKFKKNLNSLLDLSEARPAENIDFNKVNMFRDFTESIQEIRGSCKLAIVAPEDLVFGLSRMFAILSEGLSIHTRIFRSEKEAREWLGI